METAKLQATVRDQFGKGPSRRLRQSGVIPAVLYGKGIETTALAISPKALTDAFATEFGPNRVLEIEIEGKGTHRALLVEGHHHPVTRRIVHADFKKIDDATSVSVKVPLKLVGKAKGIVIGGTLRQVFRTLPVRCLATRIPPFIEHDVTEVGLEQAIAVRDLVLPEGVQVALPPAQTIGGVYGVRKQTEEEETPAAGGKPEAAAAGADAKKGGDAKKADKK